MYISKQLRQNILEKEDRKHGEAWTWVGRGGGGKHRSLETQLHFKVQRGFWVAGEYVPWAFSRRSGVTWFSLAGSVAKAKLGQADGSRRRSSSL